MFDSTLNIGIFSGVVVVILVILIFENRNKFKKPTLTSRAIGFIKYLALVIPLKPIITFFAYPKFIKRPPRLISLPQWEDKSEPLGYHINNIFEYESVTFLYAFILILILYLFIEGKNFNSNSRIKKLKKLLNQGILTQEEFNKSSKKSRRKNLIKCKYV
jgi:uncharacterized membrane protein